MVGPGFEAVMKEIEARLCSPGVDELLFNGAASGILVRHGVAEAFPSPFADDLQLLDWLQDLAESGGVRLDPVNGSAGGSLEEGRVRWHAVLPPLSRDGPLASFRRHRFDTLAVDHFVADAVTATALRHAIRTRSNLLIAGPTSSGKTSLLAALLAEVATERIILIEALPELPRFGPATIRLVERESSLDGVGAVTLSRLVRESLRLRPDRVVVGEIRGHEAQAFLEAAFTGHGGLMATIHAGSAEEARERLILLAGGGRRQRALVSALALDVAVLERGTPPRVTADFCRRTSTRDESADRSPLVP